MISNRHEVGIAVALPTSRRLEMTKQIVYSGV